MFNLSHFWSGSVGNSNLIRSFGLKYFWRAQSIMTGPIEGLVWIPISLVRLLNFLTHALLQPRVILDQCYDLTHLTSQPVITFLFSKKKIQMFFFSYNRALWHQNQGLAGVEWGPTGNIIGRRLVLGHLLMTHTSSRLYSPLPCMKWNW